VGGASYLPPFFITAEAARVEADRADVSAELISKPLRTYPSHRAATTRTYSAHRLASRRRKMKDKKVSQTI